MLCCLKPQIKICNEMWNCFHRFNLTPFEIIYTLLLKVPTKPPQPHPPGLFAVLQQCHSWQHRWQRIFLIWKHFTMKTSCQKNYIGTPGVFKNWLYLLCIVTPIVYRIVAKYSLDALALSDKVFLDHGTKFSSPPCILWRWWSWTVRSIAKATGRNWQSTPEIDLQQTWVN